MIFLPQFALVEKSQKGTGKFILFAEKESHLAVMEQDQAQNKIDFPFLLDASFVEKPLHDSVFFIGELTLEDYSMPIFTLSISRDSPLPAGWTWTSFSDFFRNLDHEKQLPLSRAKQILNWDRTHRFCGTCGVGTEIQQKEPCRKCPDCGELFYPRFSPAVIVRITRGRQIMLAHNTRFAENLYANIAGFVEAGESLEEAVRREIREEVGLEVENIRYFDSQQWPMPHSLMLGFTARCPKGEPVPDGVEITHAKWFDPENLPLLPPPGSIARRMIDDHIKKNKKNC